MFEGDRLAEDREGLATARALDAKDELARFRSRFTVPDPDLIYLDGNSLGRQPNDVPDLLRDLSDRQWADRLIRGWNDGWWELQIRLGDMLASLLGAGPGEVIISDSTSVNLFKLAGAAVRARPGRKKIVTDDLNFPTDVYVLGGLAKQHGLELEIVESDGIHGPIEALSRSIDGDTALVSLSHTTYMSGYTYDIVAINEIAHRAGALTLWDTSHSVGVVPIDFAGSGSDLATGCTYKYLNGGPGSPAFLYVRRDLQTELENPISAWWAHSDPFEMRLDFDPTDGIRRFHTGTLPILSTATIEPGISLALEAGIDAIRAKSVELTSFFIGLWSEHLTSLGFDLLSPEDPGCRGSHVSLRHSQGWQVTNALIEIGNVIPDFRAPGTIRFGFAPLYTTFEEVRTAVQRLKHLVASGKYRDVETAERMVT